MKILIAGASGAIGQPLVEHLVSHNYEVYGITQSKERAEIIKSKGAKPLILDVLEPQSVIAAIENIRPNVVVDMLTRLPKKYTPESMRESFAMNAKLRLEGGSNLLTAARIHGAKRYIAQSTAFWYEPGLGLADEHVPFAFEASPGIAEGTHVYAEIEKRILQSQKIEGVALRFGFFYGPGTWFYPGGDIAEQISKQKFPIIGKGQGIWNFVHVEDAAKAILSALTCTPGVYNIVNDYPLEMRSWLPAFANYLDAPPPPKITEEEGLKTRGKDAVYYATKLRGASNAKAKKEFRFRPRQLEWLNNFS